MADRRPTLDLPPLPDWIKERIPLDSITACQREFERCSTGLSWLDHMFTVTREAIKDAEQLMEEFEAEAAKGARRGSSDTAAEIKGRMIDWIKGNEEARRTRAILHDLRARMAQIDRWYRSLEKRGGLAQSAQNGHLGIEKLGGYTGNHDSVDGRS